METVSIIIPSLGRKESLENCIKSIRAQTYKDYKIYIINDDAPLTVCRNKGAEKALGAYLVFIDDDVICTPTWLQAIVDTFSFDLQIGGVSGPAVITEKYRKNRDLFRYEKLKKWYDKIFLEGKQALPGHITKWGAFTTGSSDESCHYNGDVHFLEACNMAFRKDAFRQAGGFDNAYGGVGEWCEPDLSFKLRKMGWKLVFNDFVKVYHQPSKSGVFVKRDNEIPMRLKNYYTFSERWIKPCWQHMIYKLFLKIYYAIKTSQRHDHH